MKKVIIIGGIILLIFGLYIIIPRVCPIKGLLVKQNLDLRNDTSTNPHPTREEWLEVYITHRIKQWTDPWEQRTAVTVWIRPEEQTIAITMTSANGQEKLTQSQQNAYILDVEKIVKTVLEKYDWAQKYKLIVQFL